MKLLFAVCLLFSLNINHVLSISKDQTSNDIKLTDQQREVMEALANDNDPNSPQRAVVLNERSLWANARVPYVLDSSLSSAARQAIQEAINDYTTMTCVRFVLRTSESDYVRFFRGQGCFSYIGRVGGPQDISIGDGCHFKGIVMHEMFHALGRWHEQSRPDRDQFVRINSQNIQEGLESNFEIVSRAFVTTQGVPYDTRSLMHYGAFAFSRNNQPTIEPVDSSISLNQLGQRSGFSSSDLQHVNTLYCSDDTDEASWSEWSAFSSCSRTCNEGQRTRTRTCVGGTTCPGSNIDTERCNTNPCPTPSFWSAWSAWSVCSASCGGGRQQRTRSCVNGNDCVGRNTEFRDCNTQLCPQPVSWSSWSSWSACSATCQGGTRFRRRSCQNGNTCSGANIQYQYCNSNLPCVETPVTNTGEWGEWSECTRDCGGGRRFRTRQCGQSDCESQSQACNTQDCNPEPELRGLRHAGCYYLNRFSRALGLLEKLTPELSDDPTTRTNPIRKCATAAQQYSFRFFALSIGYCISGSNRLSDYQYVRSESCENGIGGYTSGYFLIDIYEIENPQTFQDSISEQDITTTLEPEETTTTEAPESLALGNGAAGLSQSWNLAVLLVVAMLTFLTILN